MTEEQARAMREQLAHEYPEFSFEIRQWVQGCYVAANRDGALWWVFWGPEDVARFHQTYRERRAA